MALEHLNELIDEVRDLLVAEKGSLEPDKLRALASLAIETAQAVQDIHDRLRKMESEPL